jgi:hypothetical protein
MMNKAVKAEALQIAERYHESVTTSPTVKCADK